MSLTFVVGKASDVFAGELAQAIGDVLSKQFPPVAADGDEPYHSEPIDASGWRLLQQRVLQTIDLSPQLASVDAYQAVYLPSSHPNVEHLPVPNVADPVQVGSLPLLLDELRRFAASNSLPTDDLELMELAAHYLESDDPDADLDVQTYVQLMLSAKQAVSRGQALWVVV